jgi:hypothetical protein
MAYPPESLLGRLTVEFFGEDALDYGGVARLDFFCATSN